MHKRMKPFCLQIYTSHDRKTLAHSRGNWDGAWEKWEEDKKKKTECRFQIYQRGLKSRTCLDNSSTFSSGNINNALRKKKKKEKKCDCFHHWEWTIETFSVQVMGACDLTKRECKRCRAQVNHSQHFGVTQERSFILVARISDSNHTYFFVLHFACLWNNQWKIDNKQEPSQMQKLEIFGTWE